MNTLRNPTAIEEEMLRWREARVEDLVPYLSMATLDEVNVLMRFADGLPDSHLYEIEQRQQELEKQAAAETLAA